MNDDGVKLGKEYVKYISGINHLEPSVLMYGSTVYGKISSDLDVSLVVKDFSREDFDKLKRMTIDFQRQNGLSLDEEVPYESKLMYREADVEEMLKNSPFQKIDGVYKITPVEKSKDFLSSKEMKYRLLLNILTTRSLLLAGDSEKIKAYKQKAWELLVDVIISYNKLEEVKIDHFLELLYKDEKTGHEGEMFLGYKDNIPQKKIDLAEDCESTFRRLAQEGKMRRIDTDRYILAKDKER